jgi:hypothetical protein
MLPVLPIAKPLMGGEADAVTVGQSRSKTYVGELPGSGTAEY